MDLILLDWTRMGRSYCLAGAVAHEGGYRIIRPILYKFRDAPVRNVGWSPYLLDGHQRWEVFEIIGPIATPPDPPHVEDLWVRGLRPRHRLAPREERQAILTATAAPPGELLFGTPFEPTRAVAIGAATGHRSLITVVVSGTDISFTGSHRRGPEPDYRVTLCLPELGERSLPMKDHQLLCRAEAGANTLDARLARMTQLVRGMGDQVAVRLGLTRPFQSEANRAGMCWLMADGFFSISDPQP